MRISDWSSDVCSSDLSRVDSPAFVVDAAKLRANCQVLADIRDAAGIRMLAALKAFSMWSVAPILGEYLDGVCASGLRSEERRAGKECVRTCRSRWSP